MNTGNADDDDDDYGSSGGGGGGVFFSFYLVIECFVYGVRVGVSG